MNATRCYCGNILVGNTGSCRRDYNYTLGATTATYRYHTNGYLPSACRKKMPPGGVEEDKQSVSIADIEVRGNTFLVR